MKNTFLPPSPPFLTTPTPTPLTFCLRAETETRRIWFCFLAPVLAGIRNLAADSQPEYFSPLPDEIY